MSNRKSEYDEALHASRRAFLKNTLSVAAGLGAASVAGLPTLARATGSGSTTTSPYVNSGSPPRWGGGYTQGPMSYNLLTGNCLLTYPIACGDSLDFVLYHNSTLTTTGGPLGSKWRHSFSGQIVTGTGQATYVAANGTQFVFTQSGSTYTAPTGLHKTLVKNVDNSWTLTDLQGTLDVHFLASGVLDAVRNTLTGAVLIQCNYTSGNLTSVVTGGDTLSFGYTGTLLTSITDLTGNVHTLGYTSGRLTSHSFPVISSTTYTTQFAYNANGVVNAITDPASHSCSFTYNTAGLLTGSTDYQGNTTSYLAANSNPSPSGWPTNVVSAAIVTTAAGAMQHGFDSGGRVVAYAGVGIDRSVSTYDSQNNLTSQTLASGGTWSWTYDSAGRVLTTTAPTGVVGTNTRDSNGRVTAETIGGISASTATYDSNSQITQIALTGGDTFTAVYDSSLNLTSVTDTTSGASASSTYDSHGNVLTYTNPSGYTASYSYTNNLLSSATDARGRVMNFTRDAWGVVTGVAFPTSGHTSEAWVYDPLGNRSSGSNAAGSYSYGLNSNSSRTSKTGPEGTVSATYDSNRRPATVTDTAGRSHTITWGTNDAISSIVLSDGTGTVQYAYNSSNQLSSCTLPNGTIILYGYDANSRLTSVTNKIVSSGVVIVSYTGTFNATTGLVSQVTEQPSGAVTAFTYDSLGRITQEARTGSSPYQANYTYGPLGQVATAVRSENGVTSHNGAYTYTTGGLLSQVVDSATSTTENYTWYHDGKLSSFPGPGYTRELDYYENGRLLSISRNYGSGGSVAYQFAYDPDGCLAWYKDYISGTITQFVCGVGQFAGAVLLVNQKPISGGSWTEVARYIQGAHGVASVSGSFFAGGLIGAPFLATNTSASTVGTCLFDSFGVIRFATGVLTTQPGRVVLDGVTLSIPGGSSSIVERYLQIG